MNYFAFRTDASQIIGSGHVMRCLTLAEKLRDRGDVVKFISREHKGNLNELIRSRGFEVSSLRNTRKELYTDVKTFFNEEVYQNCLGVSVGEDANDTKDSLQGQKIDWLIIDHYSLGEKWERELRQHVKNIMVIDDLANRHHDCDILLDQNWFENPETRYTNLIPFGCTKLFGPKYALLRPEFNQARKLRRETKRKVERLFVFYGGSDPHNLTGMTIKALSTPELAHLYVDVVIGENNANRNQIQNMAKSRGLTHLHIQVDDIAAIMAKADLALGSVGVNTWERICLGLPTLAITYAENHDYVIKDLLKFNYINYLGDISNIDEYCIMDKVSEIINDQSLFSEQVEKIKHLEIGDGVKNVSEWLIGNLSNSDWRVKTATEKDMGLYWVWANDEGVRKSALNKEPIPWSSHKKWFTEKINNKGSILYKIEVDKNPIGQVRFDIEKNFARIDYSIEKKFRGRKLGGKLLKVALEEFHNNYSNVVAGEVIPENIASAKIFESLGFKKSVVNNNNFFTKKPENYLSNAE